MIFKRHHICDLILFATLLLVCSDILLKCRWGSFLLLVHNCAICLI